MSTQSLTLPRPERSDAASRRILAAMRPAGPTFHPAPYQLIEISWADHSRHDDEHVANDSPHCAGMSLDPWRKGDLLAVERMLPRASYLPCRERLDAASRRAQTETSSTWHIARRASIPSAKRQLLEIIRDGVPSRFEPFRSNCKLFRIVLRCLPAAEKFIGREFASRAEIETALLG